MEILEFTELATREYTLQKFVEIGEYVSRKTGVPIRLKQVDDPANIYEKNLVVNNEWQLLTPAEQREIMHIKDGEELREKLIKRVNELENIL